jgi:hypothetical protein
MPRQTVQHFVEAGKVGQQAATSSSLGIVKTDVSLDDLGLLWLGPRGNKDWNYIPFSIVSSLSCNVLECFTQSMVFLRALRNK